MEKTTTNAQIFLWVGRDRKGTKLNGELSATSRALVKVELRRQGILPIKIRKKTKPLFSMKGKKVSAAEVTTFTRQAATMIGAGIPLIQTFDIIAKGHSNPQMQTLLTNIKTEVESGSAFADALRKHPKYFNALFCNLVDAGEQSGALESMLDRLATHKEKTESIKKKVKKALFYPTAVLVIAFLVSAGLLIFVVPQFEAIFSSFGAELPAMTRYVITLSEIFQSYWYIIFALISFGAWSFVYFRRTSEKFSNFIDRLSLRIPLIGPILEKATIARFTRTLSTTFAAGVPLVEALTAVAFAVGNHVYCSAVLHIRDTVATGGQLQQAMRNTNLFPNMVVQMIVIGEESGALEQMLSKVADIYEEEVDNAVESLSSLIEPLIMVILGILIGGIVIAMYLPIFKLGSVI